MAMLTSAQTRFLETRGRLIRYWPVGAGVLWVLFVLLVALGVWRSPWLFNPFDVLERMRFGRIEPTTIRFMAVLLPIVVHVCLFLLLVLIIAMTVMIGHEVQYQRIIAALRDEVSGARREA